MRTALIIIIGFHGMIHLLGFLKAFGIIEFSGLSQPISKPLGYVWLLTFAMFLLTSILMLFRNDYWWILGLVCALFSQFLVLTYWQDARFGTILNLIILFPVIVNLAAYSFNNRILQETGQMLESKQSIEWDGMEQQVSKLPQIVQKWLDNSGAVDGGAIHSVCIEQDVQMLLKPGQENWINGKARQYFTLEPPAFHWVVKLKMNPIISIVGRDRFEDGLGSMTIKLFSLLPIVNVHDLDNINQAALQRYLAEIIWFPSAALSPHITWEVKGEHSARATLEFGGTKGSGIFHFDSEGNFMKFEAMRYKEINDNEPTPWVVNALKYQLINEVKIPVEAKVSWMLESGEWNWLKIRVNSITYNINESIERKGDIVKM